MDRAEFAAWLMRLLTDDHISEEQAEELLALYDAGDVPWAEGDWPQPPAQAVRGLDEDDVLAAMLLLLMLLSRRAGEQINQVPRQSWAPRLILATQLQDEFGIVMRQLAARLSSGDLALADWQAIMATSLRTHHSQMALLALGTNRLPPVTLTRLGGLMSEQTAYLSRYADQIAYASLTGQPFSEAYLANRSRQYAGPAWEQYWLLSEETDEDNGETGWGWVYDYISQDDERTCDPCIVSEINGPYLAGQGPYPARECLGRGLCRCHRRPRYDPTTYQALMAGL